MALFVAAKFSHEEMPTVYDPGPLQDLKPEEFIVVPRNAGEDVAFISGLEHKSVHQMKLRRDPYPRVIRRAKPAEVEAWWDRKGQERRGLVLAKEKARTLGLDIKISTVRFDPAENKATFHFTSDQRVDFRALVKELSAILKMRIELWQIGVRDEARMVDGFGVCGMQTCCSTWLTEFRPITIRMAKDQDINLPPNKLSGQCGRLLCCLSYEVDTYKSLARAALPKGATVAWGEKQVIIVDRNLVAGSYVVAEVGGSTHHVKAEELAGGTARIPEQMKHFGKKFSEEHQEEVAEIPSAPPAATETASEAPAAEAPPPRDQRGEDRSGGRKGKGGRFRGERRRGRRGENAEGGQAQASEGDGAQSPQRRPGEDVAKEGEEKPRGPFSGRRKKKRRGRG